MKINEDLKVTEMHLDGFKVPVPEGLSELLNRSGGWKYISPDQSESKVDNTKNYDRKVVREDGKLRTYLTYKSPPKASKQKIS
ncbi:hypothetical protein [Metabacillus halosaccharovorans]|uniref:Uncharacterized protein n=1 Tax=Metabacillus halosaccharovorans TaxID=930124 RepID=A0ABT3DCF4_9BACI|nr:hypothetical protein [Metabacillus halosaccharovorans]MCV9884733.1 hypothetical protein [Metabacillus halosaccharovorans]